MISTQAFKVVILIIVSFVAATGTAQRKDNYVQILPGTLLKIEMVAIPEGHLTMGNSQNSIKTEVINDLLCTNQVEGFWMSSLEVTWGLYNLFLQRSLEETPSEKMGDEVTLNIDAVAGATIPYVDMSLGMGTDNDLPVANVTRLAASKFCEWLSAKTGNFYRLPTEVEWEYAARAGSEENYFFKNIDSLDTYAWFSQNSDDSYHKVGQKKPNPWGLYDIYGNVAEWTLDEYTENICANKKEPFAIFEKEYPVVVRGGSYKDTAEDLKSTSRIPSSPIWKQRDPQFPKSKWWFTDAPFVGFRIVRPYQVPNTKEQKAYWLYN